MPEIDETKRVAVTLTRDDADLLSVEAGRAGIGPGLLSRALIRYGLDHIGDAGVQAVIDEVKTADRRRRTEIGKKAMESRWNPGGESEERTE